MLTSNMKEFNIKVMDHTAVLSDFGKITISTSKPKVGKIALRLIRFTGKALADIRKEFNIKSQTELANRLTAMLPEGRSVSQSLVSLMENGAHEPNGEQLVAIQDLFSGLAGYKVIFYFDRAPEDAKKDPDEYWGQKA